MQPQPSPAGAASTFAIDQARHAEARLLPGCCYDDFLRLSRSLIHGPPFQWLLVEAPDERLRRQVMAALERLLRLAGLSSDRMTLNDRIADVPMLEARLERISRSAPVVHVICRPGWFDQARWQAFNIRRERLAARARARLLFWLDTEALALACRAAPDLWAWRGGIYTFVAPPAPLESSSIPAEDSGGLSPFPSAFRPVQSGLDPRSKAEKSRRVAEINTWIAQHPEAPPELMLAPLVELGDLLFNLGDLDAALRHWRETQLPFFERLGDLRAKAVTMGRIADVLQVQGQLDEALWIRREEQLPVYERLGDVRGKAVTMGKIADVLQSRGQLEEALRIRQDEELPVYQSLGDVRTTAIAMAKIADVLQLQGHLVEALQIQREKVLPVIERLGDLRAKAVTMGKIANVFQAQGQLEEALQIRREVVLPLFEQLGDVRNRATTMGGIADVLQARGQLDEALRIRREEQIPAYVRLGDLGLKAFTMKKISDILQARGQLNEALQTLQRDVLPVLDSLGLEPDRAVVLARIQAIQQQLNQLTQAPASAAVGGPDHGPMAKPPAQSP